MPSSRSVGQDLVLEVAGEERVLRLERGDRVRGVRAADGGGRRLGEAEVAHLAGGDQLGHRADGLLDRDRLVDAVLVVEVDVVDAEPLQRGVARGADVLRAAVDADPGAVGEPLVAELGGELDLVAAAGDRLADQLLVGERAVHVGGVEEGHAEVERAVDGGEAGRLVGAAVELRHAHAAEAERGDVERRRWCRACAFWIVMPPLKRLECAPGQGRRPWRCRCRSCGRSHRGAPAPPRAAASTCTRCARSRSRRAVSLPSPCADQLGVAAYVADRHAGAAQAVEQVDPPQVARRCSDGDRSPERPTGRSISPSRS